MKNLFLFAIIFFPVAFLTSCGKDDPDTSGPEIKLPEINVDIPIVETQDGIQTVTLKWESKNTVSLTLQGEPVSLSGSAKIPISSDTQFTFVGENQEGKVTSKTVPVVLKKIPTLILTATPAVVPPEGASVHITWVETNANLGVWLNNVPYFDGETGVTIFVPARGLDTLTFIAKGSGGETTAKLYIPVDVEIPNTFSLMGSWKLTEAYETCDSLGIYHQPISIGECESDDLYIFSSTRVEYNLGNVLCEGQTTSVHYFDYHIVGDSLYGLGNPRFLKEKTDNTLIWEFEDQWMVNGKIFPYIKQEVFVLSN